MRHEQGFGTGPAAGTVCRGGVGVRRDRHACRHPSRRGHRRAWSRGRRPAGRGHRPWLPAGRQVPGPVGGCRPGGGGVHRQLRRRCHPGLDRGRLRRPGGQPSQPFRPTDPREDRRLRRLLRRRSGPIRASYRGAEGRRRSRCGAPPRWRTTRSSALRERTATFNHIKAMLIAGPESLRARYRGLSNSKLTTALASSRPPAQPVTAEEATAYSSCCPTPISADTFAIVRPVSMTRRAATRRAASCRYFGVQLFLFAPMKGILPCQTKSDEQRCPPDGVDLTYGSGLSGPRASAATCPSTLGCESRGVLTLLGAISLA